MYRMIIVLLLAGCGANGMTEDEIIAMNAKCEAAGMVGRVGINGFNERFLHCYPKSQVTE